MDSPIRIQRRRVRGYKFPENTFFVGRPGRWGNMFKTGQQEGLGGDVVYVSTEGRRQTTDEWIVLCVVKEGSGPKMVHDLYWHVVNGDADAIQRMLELSPKEMMDINRWIKTFEDYDVTELRGKNLACYCPLDFEHCHASVLLFFANRNK